MSEPTSHICPECFTPRAADGTPSCACGRRASEALLETRTAEAAAAEDFDPLRIRPYVELGDDHDAAGPHPDRTPTTAMPMTTATAAMPVATGTTTAATGTTAPGGPNPWRSPVAGPTTSAAPTTPFPSPSSPSSVPSAGRSRGRRRRRTGLMVALAGTAAAGVMAAAGFASGLFSYEAPERDRALPDDLRASVPDTSPDGEASPVKPSGEGGGGGGAPAPAPSSGGGAGSPSPTKESSPSPSPSKPSGSPSPSVSPSPGRSAPSAGASTGSSAAGANEADDSRLVVPKTLRVGDDDPEVTELQLRLRQLGIYTGDIDQNFDDQVEQAVIVYQNTRGITKDKEEPGVYGLVTRQRLETETKEP
ncbi:peptidoglycan-binding domain-containing protein [Streptomyces caniscabiei]|uniref:Peptidoglycan-binding protein n=1 Tax=Streptomyces caniscabiei TaxID=2746961 RepID=A0A927QNC2_9ACTN|nr:peptidoglycan-binding domain-containing protein [Streptomyces caniscabiei]MBD9727797.1 peptidoglycan-binding protein [Streptomyces caniscabiei]MDX3513530.1 peptidoglycan-binding domain-containing protein [Streptomyces caniscabiei]MDX3722335.1 peptidoglycan-binding domain-containing protein [Streptomyces caniscabiei]WEO27360.1 peptidoglycan-binding domain-containing protein [Streptomyces caniscabiei]